ncbi:response regulator [Paenibacillus phocaensis]|uniref:response regulator n=1 Tax=Paenibacillus phocaensis TaxID=1776378 RepID=UPI00039F0096|nr:response regulator [Paenibacillus phocaensis]
MRLKALLVDDEIHILTNLSKVLPWEEIGFEHVLMAKNGKEALELASQHRPDLILSDIRMPVMDGIQLLQELREREIPCEILLLTGYQEFEYARTAIRYGVKDYICKPINYFELEETVRTVAKQIREKRKNLNKEQRLHQVVDLANENFLLHSLLGQETDGEGLLWDEEDGQMEQRRYSMLLLDLEGYSHRSIVWTLHERKAWNLHIRHALKEIFGELLPDLTVLQIREGEWCLVFPASAADEPLDEEALMAGYEQIRQLIRSKEELPVRIGMSAQPSRLQELSVLYHRLQHRLILGSAQGGLVEADWVSADELRADTDAVDLQWGWIEQLGTGLRNGSHEALERITGELKSFYGRLDEQRAGAAEKLMHYLLIHLLREMRELQMLPLEQEEALWQRLREPMSLKELLSLILSLIEQSRSCLSAKKSTELLMMSAQSYIQNHLGHDFGIEDIADYLGISSSYFCLLFKNHFGETFVEYLTKQRMEMAKCLLRSSERSIAQIGISIGYQERRYFTKVFQKYTGMTPSDFRQKESNVS